MDRKSLKDLRLDRRLVHRSNWISGDEIDKELESLPDVSDKIAPRDEEGAAPAEAPQSE